MKGEMFGLALENRKEAGNITGLFLYVYYLGPRL